VVGGRYIEGVKELTQTYRHGLFTHIMVYIYNTNSHWGGAFPSSHVAVALTISLISFRYFKYFAWILFVNTIFLSISTVFCHYHYFIDVIGGVIYGLLMYGVSELMYSLKNKLNTNHLDY
jgi:membrane-associated phospholipid phosphatase